MGRRRFDDDLDQLTEEIPDLAWLAEHEQRIAAHERRVAKDLRRLGLSRDGGTGSHCTALYGDHASGVARARSA